MVSRGKLYVIAAPSGAGKTTLVTELVKSVPNLIVSISHTTRPKRVNEEQGINYHFVDKATFQEMIHQGDFLEHAVIFEHLYGTSKKWVEETLARGRDVILEIDWQGQQQIKKLFPDVISIFILPPSLADLRARLIKRDQDHPEIIIKRLEDAKETVSHINEFDYVVVNDEFNQAIQDLKSIIEAIRLQRVSQIKRFAKLIQEFMQIS